MSYKAAGGGLFMEPVSVSFLFYLEYRFVDLDNLIKGILDSLLGVAIFNDDVKHVRSYDSVQTQFIEQGGSERAVIRFRPIQGGSHENR